MQFHPTLCKATPIDGIALRNIVARKCNCRGFISWSRRKSSGIYWIRFRNKRRKHDPSNQQPVRLNRYSMEHYSNIWFKLSEIPKKLMTLCRQIRTSHSLKFFRGKMAIDRLSLDNDCIACIRKYLMYNSDRIFNNIDFH